MIPVLALTSHAMADSTELEAPPESRIPGLPADWPQQATARVVRTVDSVRSKTAGPAIRVSRAIVYGLVALTLTLVALPLLLIGLTRMLDYFMPGHIWRTYAAMGGFLTFLGLVLWSFRPRGAARPGT